MHVVHWLRSTQALACYLKAICNTAALQAGEISLALGCANPGVGAGQPGNRQRCLLRCPAYC